MQPSSGAAVFDRRRYRDWFSHVMQKGKISTVRDRRYRKTSRREPTNLMSAGTRTFRRLAARGCGLGSVAGRWRGLRPGEFHALLQPGLILRRIVHNEHSLHAVMAEAAELTAN